MTAAGGGDDLTAELPGQPDPTTVYYSLEAIGRRMTASEATARTPLDGDVNPFVYFVSSTHLSDLDRHDDLLDVFDLVRLMRGVAWRDGASLLPKLDLNGDGAIDVNDVRSAVDHAARRRREARPVAAPDVLRWEVDAVVLSLADGRG